MLQVGAILMAMLTVLAGADQTSAQEAAKGATWVTSHGYSDCVQLSNERITVILEPNCGGRVLEYSFEGRNAIYVDPQQDGWTYTPGQRVIGPCAGRFDIGPEMLVPRRPNLWVGRWSAEIMGPYAARLTSVEDPDTGIQLVRDFRLAPDSSRLECKQTIRNISDSTQRYSHWSRTFATGGGICIVPLTENSRFPGSYILYGPGPVMNYRPGEHPNVRVRDGFLEILGTPPQPKFGIDSYAGWLAYITRDDLLFVKRYPVYPDRVYGEMAGITVSIWYFQEKMCELEPIGPWEILEPGASASFTEEWWLLPYDYPQPGHDVDLNKLSNLVDEHTR